MPSKEYFRDYARKWRAEHPGRAAAAQARYRERHPERSHASWLKCMYKITPEEETRLKSGPCQLCKKRPATNIDHDKETGRWRGGLCTPCNTGLGKLGDNIEGLRRALDYLVEARSRG